MKKYAKINILFVSIMIAFIVLLGIVTGLKRIYLSDFVPINGDFQNYNGFRRLLDGQVPFRDFYFYLGLGPLYLNSLFLLVIGNSFTNSLFVTNTITALMFSIAIFVVLKLNRIKSDFFILIVTFMLSAFALGYKDVLNLHLFFEKFNFFSYASPGVSIRMQRAFLPFFIAFVALLVSYRKKVSLVIKNENYRIILFGFFSGSCIAWSNDYGISVCLALCYIFTLKYFQWNLKFVKKVAMLTVSVCIGALFIISVLTVGNTFEWVNYNFLGVAKDQFWYYERTISSKLLVLSDLPRNFEIICGLIYIIYLSYKIRKKNYCLEDMLLLFVMLSTLIAGYAYAVSSLKAGQFIPYMLVFYVTVFSLFINTLKNNIKYKGRIVAFSKVFIVVIISIVLVPQTFNSINQLNTERGVYLKKLDGNFSRYGDSLNLLSDYFVTEGDDLFSTYSSALDVMTDKFQPSGIDYIIHVLGDQYRDKYLNSFRETDPKYITTIREDFTNWEYWVKRENWFFYREFLSHYEPVAVTEYNVLWEKTNHVMTLNALAKNVRKVQVSDSSWKIYVTTDSAVNNAIADITIQYSSDWNAHRWKGMGIRKLVHVADGWGEEGNGGYNIPPNHNNFNIPVRIINGEGVIQISSYPINLTQLEVENVVVNKFYKDSIDYGALEEKMFKDERLTDALDKETVNIADFTDNNWLKGVNRGRLEILLFERTFNNLINLKNSSEIEINNESYSIQNVEIKGSQWVHVYLDRPISDQITSFKLK